jgi:hypothetical protein
MNEDRWLEVAAQDGAMGELVVVDSSVMGPPRSTERAALSVRVKAPPENPFAFLCCDAEQTLQPRDAGAPDDPNCPGGICDGGAVDPTLPLCGDVAGAEAGSSCTPNDKWAAWCEANPEECTPLWEIVRHALEPPRKWNDPKIAKFLLLAYVCPKCALFLAISAAETEGEAGCAAAVGVACGGLRGGPPGGSGRGPTRAATTSATPCAVANLAGKLSPKDLEILKAAAEKAGGPGPFMRDLTALAEVVAEKVPGGQVWRLGEVGSSPIYGTVRTGTGIVDINGVTTVVRALPGRPVEILGPLH